MDLLQQIQQWAAQSPEAIAHRSGEHMLSYGALWHASGCVAGYLAAQHPGDRSPVAVIGHKEPEMLAAFLGAVRAGHPYVPIDSATPPQRVESIVKAAGVKAILRPADMAVLTEKGAEQGTAADAGLAQAMSADDPFYIIFTSGSTGDPKGVVVTLGCLTSFLEWMLGEHPFRPQEEVFLNQAPFSFDLSVMDLYLSLVTGGTLFSLQQGDIANPAQLYRVLAQSGVSVWVSTPSVAQMCLAEPSFGPAMLPELRRFLFCGETLPPEVAAMLLERFAQAEVWNTYGPTEATVATTSVRVDSAVLARWKPLPVGYPKPGSKIVVVDEQLQPVADGATGEIVIAGPNVSLGYIGRPDLTERAFLTWDGMRAYRTGDWGHYADGMLFFEGRRDDQVKLHGYRIELGDIEAHLQALPGVRSALVLPKLKDGRPDWLAAFVVLAEEAPGDHAGSDFEKTRVLRGQLAGVLPSYMIPRKFYFLPAFPMTPNGKADRRQLARMLE